MFGKEKERKRDRENRGEPGGGKEADRRTDGKVKGYVAKMMYSWGS